MAAIHSALQLLASQSLAAGASVHGAELDNTTGYGALIFVKITNGASAPTTPPVVKFYLGEASGVKRLAYQQPGDTVNGNVSEPWFEVSAKAMFANVTVTNGATNPVTVEIYAQRLPSI